VQAQRVRRLIQYSFDDVFSFDNILHSRRSGSAGGKCDFILCPTTIGPAPELSSIATMTPVETFVNDVFTVPGSLAGLPAISLPVQVHGHYVGLQLLGQVGADNVLLEVAKSVEDLLRHIDT
jgi:aspartyl-tRNA(Asn)/glutamyl-tRNA(Gln) amidotransferase subunit A